MVLLVQLLVLLVVARLLGEAALRLGLPAIVGELAAGILIALAIVQWVGEVPLLWTLAPSPALAIVGQAGMFMIVLAAGLEMKPEALARNTKLELAVGLGGAALPLAAGVGAGYLLLPPIAERPILALVIGITLSITAIPLTVRMLSDFGRLESRLGQVIVGAALVDDVVGLFLLALLSAVIVEGGLPSAADFALQLVKIAAFFAIVVLLGVHVYPRLRGRIPELRLVSIEFSALMAVALGYAALAELLGMHWVMGAFMAGLYFEPARVGRRAYHDMRLIATGLSNGFLGPLFFASIGLQVEPAVLGAVPLFVLALMAMALAAKLVGAGLPALLAREGAREALAIGIGMGSRGAVALVVVTVAREAGVFDLAESGAAAADQLYSALVLTVIATSLLTPILLRFVLKGLPK